MSMQLQTTLRFDYQAVNNRESNLLFYVSFSVLGGRAYESSPHSSVRWVGSFDVRRRSRSSTAQGPGARPSASMLAKPSRCVGAQRPARSEAAAHSRQ